MGQSSLSLGLEREGEYWGRRRTKPGCCGCGVLGLRLPKVSLFILTADATATNAHPCALWLALPSMAEHC